MSYTNIQKELQSHIKNLEKIDRKPFQESLQVSKIKSPISHFRQFIPLGLILKYTECLEKSTVEIMDTA